MGFVPFFHLMESCTKYLIQWSPEYRFAKIDILSLCHFPGVLQSSPPVSTDLCHIRTTALFPHFGIRHFRSYHKIHFLSIRFFIFVTIGMNAITCPFDFSYFVVIALLRCRVAWQAIYVAIESDISMGLQRRIMKSTYKVKQTVTTLRVFCQLQCGRVPYHTPETKCHQIASCLFS